MKKFMRNILSVVVSAALLVSSTIPVLADGHSHGGGTEITETPSEPTYTITLTTPVGTELNEDSTYEYGAYQIFSGTVPTNPESVVGSEYNKEAGGYQNPGDELAALPITDIKWGNAFGTVDGEEWQDNIVKFVLALAKAPTGAYSYAFHDFEGFDGFIEDKDSNYLAARFYNDPNGDGTLEDSEKINKNVNFDKLAVEVADVLADPEHQNHEWLQAFTDILGGYAQGEEGKYLNKGYVEHYYKSKSKGTTGSEPDKVNTYEITVPAGYYMIRDLSKIGENESYSARMLFVASNVTQTLKESVPTLEKQIVRADGKDYETEAAGVGDVVTYKLTGTLPSNYDEYLGGYQYTFIDELSDGLTLNEIATSTGTYVTVTVKGLFKWVPSTGLSGEGTWEWDSTATATIPIHYNDTEEAQKTHENENHLGTGDGEVPYNYQDTYTPADAEKPAQLKVFFPCLKEIRITGDGKDGTESGAIYRLGYDDEDGTAADGTTTFNSSRIYVTYTATVNGNAVVTNPNENTATLEYSDNPQSYADTNTTTKDTAEVYTFGLEITKVNASEFIKADGKTTNPDGSVNEKVVLANVEFALIRQKPGVSGTEYQIAKFLEVGATGETGDPFGGKAYKSIEKWDDLSVGADQTLEGAVKAFLYDASGIVSGRGNYILISDTNGNICISGLDDGITYTMVESKAPEKFATIDPFTFSLTAAKKGGTGADKDEYTGQLESVTVTKGIGDKDPVDLEHYVDITNEGFTSAAVSSSSSDPAEIKYTAGKVENEGIIEMLVDNFEYENLPSTGGMGTYLYYIIGGGVILLAAVLFFLSRKKPAKTVK